MNLFEKLHPVYKDKISIANLQYPDLIEALVNELESVEFVTELKYGSVMDLRIFCAYLNNPFDYFTE